MTKEILEQLFDSSVKVRLLKLFLRNPNKKYTLYEVAKRTQSDKTSCRRQIEKLETIQLILKKMKEKKRYYQVNPSFVFYGELRTLILKSSPASKEKMLAHVKTLGKINLFLLSGIFINTENARADLLIVGDALKRKRLSNFLRSLEAEVGKEIDYVVMTTDEFKYRHDMFDRFLIDVLEKPHENLINKLKIK